MDPELLADYQCECGENPLWHHAEKCVYWVDIPSGRLFRYSSETGVHQPCFQSAEALGGFTLQADGALLLFLARGAVKRWREWGVSTVIEEIPDERETRFNDVIADPVGRVFCGTMPTASRLGRLYRLDLDGTITKVLDDVGCPNGMGFTRDYKRMYFTDSAKGEIYLFDYDKSSGALSNRRVFLSMPKEQGCPDGMTVDAEGFVWSAIWDGSCAIRFAPDGREDRRIPFPVKKVSSLTFGGDNYTDVYVSTAGGLQKETDGAGAGGLYWFTSPVPGVPEFPSRILL